MKHSVTTKSAPFTPVVLTVVLESQKELDAFYCIFNHSSISDAAAKVFGVHSTDFDMAATLRRSGASYDTFGEYAEALKRDINS